MKDGPAVPPPRRDAERIPSEAAGRVKVLIVDDTEDIRSFGERILGADGFEVSSAVSGDAAVKRLSEGWDIVLTDIGMPGTVDGNELVRRVRKGTTADALVMTGYPELGTAVQSLRDGAYDYLIKPFNRETLLAAVRRCVDKRRLSVELAQEKALRAALEETGRVKEMFGQFVTPEVVQYVTSLPAEEYRQGARKVVTILFADARGFTPFAGTMPPEEVVDALNGIFSRVAEAVQREGGIINKFMGDGLLAIFGAPLPLADHAQAAARAALAARDAVDSSVPPRGELKRLRIGIGINTGEVVAGCLGYRDRREYSVIGHAVNLAARLEEVSAPGQILLGPETVRQLRSSFLLTTVPPILLEGIPEPVPVSVLQGLLRPEAVPAL